MAYSFRLWAISVLSDTKKPSSSASNFAHVEVNSGQLNPATSAEYLGAVLDYRYIKNEHIRK
jgi:hypothetical protein